MYIQNATYKTIPTEGLTFPLEAGTVLTVNNITGIVPENVAVAAPTGVLYLAVGGTIDLTSEANAGITFTDAELNALSGDFNFIPLAESGGGGLPEFTSADKGKFLGLGEADPVETVIVPEQTGEFIADFGIGKGFTVSNPNLAFFQSAELGDTCEAIVGGSSYTLTYADYNGTLAFLDGSMLYALVPIYVDTEVEEVEFVSTTAAIHDTATISATASVPSVEPKWEAVSGGYIYTASSTFQSGIMGLLQTAVTDMATNNKTFAFAEGIILSDEDAAAVSEMGTNPARARILRAINQDFAVVRSDGESITVILPYYEKAISTQLTYYLSMSFTLGASSKKCFVRVTLLGHS